MNSDGAFYDLDAAVERGCGTEVPMPCAPHLEGASFSQVATIVSPGQRMVQSNGSILYAKTGDDMDKKTLVVRSARDGTFAAECL